MHKQFFNFASEYGDEDDIDEREEEFADEDAESIKQISVSMD